jgi:hypothetical protein
MTQLDPQDAAYWDQTLRQDAQAQQLRSSLAYGMNFNPDVRAKTQMVAAANGVSPAFAQNNQPALEKAARLNGFDFDDFIQNAPKTAQWFSQPENAAVAHDDLGTLTQLEQAFKGVRNGPGQNDVGAGQADQSLGYSYFPGGVTLRHGDNAVYLPSSGQWVNKDASGNFVAVGNENFQPGNLWQRTEGQLGLGWSATPQERQVLYQLKGAPSSTLASLRGAVMGTVWGTTGGAVRMVQKALQAADQFEQGQYSQGENLSFGDLGVTQYLGNLADTAETLKNQYAYQPTPLTGVRGFTDGAKAAASLVGGVIPYMSPGGLSAGGKMFLDAFGRRSAALDQQGMGAGENLALSAGAAIPDLMIGMAGHGAVPEAPNLLRNLLLQPAATGTAFLAKHFGDQVVDEALGINPIQDPNETTGDWLLRNLKNGGGESFLSGFALTAIPSLIPAVAQEMENRRNVNLFQTLGDTAQNSKLAKRLPPAFQDLAKRITEDGPVQNIFVEPEALQTYYQGRGVDPAAVMQELGVKNYEEALAAGTRVVIPIDQFTAKVAPDPNLMNAIAKDMTFHQDGMTPREYEAAKALMPAYQADLGERGEQIRQAVQADPAKQAVFEGMRQNLVDLGFEPSTAENYALGHAEVMGNLARESGRDPLDLQNEYGLQVFRQRPGESITDAILRNTGNLAAAQEGLQQFDQPAYHGSPYKFDQFSLDHLGAGEGAQAQGWGLYFAGDKDVAEHYRQVLAKHGPTLNGELIPEDDPRYNAVSRIAVNGYSGVNAVTQVKADIDAGRLAPEEGHKMISEIEALKGAQIRMGEDKGQLYKADIPEDRALLDWDKSLKGQPEALKAIRKLLLSDAVEQRALDDYGVKTRASLIRNVIDDQTTGQEIYGDLSSIFRTDKGASQALNSVGLKGIKYLDGNSRDAGEGHHNYVIFDDKATKILQTYYQGPKEPAGVGPIFTEFRGDAKGAVAKLLEARSGEALGALSHPDIKDPIDLVWGKEGTPKNGYEDGFGLAKIAQKHPEVLEDLQGALSNMEVKSRSKNRIVLESPTHKAAVRLDWDGISKTWLLSAYQKRGVGDGTRTDTADVTGEDGTASLPTNPEGNVPFSSEGDNGNPDGGQTFFQSGRGDFGSKEWNEYYALRHGSRATSDQALRARAALKAAGTQKGQAEFDAQRELEAKTQEDLFSKWDEDVKQLQAGDVHSDDARGFMQISPDGKLSIGLRPGADLSTLVHELAHAHLEIIKDLAEDPNSSDRLKQDFQLIRDFVGAKDGEDLTTEQHEQFARAAEAYLMEGKAPSEALRGVFARFKGWMQFVYRKLANLKVELTPEIRGVFDRLYASDQEIEAAQKRMGGEEPLFASAKDMRVTPAEYEIYRNLIPQEIQAAQEDLRGQVMDEFQKQQSRERRAREQEIRNQVAQDVDARPEYQAIRALRSGEMEDGTKITLNKDELIRQFGEDRVRELQRLHPNLYRVEGGMDAEAVAEYMGFDSGDHLVRTLEGTPKRGDTIDRETGERMKAEFGDPATDGSIADDATRGLHNVYRERRLLLELKAAARLKSEAGPFVDLQRRMDAAKTEEERQAAQTAWEGYQADQARQAEANRSGARGATLAPTADMFRATARDLVEKEAIRDLNPNAYLLASRKANRESFEAMAKDDYGRAYEAKQRETLNHFLYLEASKARAEANKIQGFLADSMKASTRAKLGKAGGDFLDQQDAILNRYDLQKVSNKALDQRRSLQAWADAMVSKGEQPAIDPQILNESRQVNWREIPITELRAVRDAVKNIQHLAARENELRIGDEKADWEQAKGELTRAAREAFPTKPLPMDPNVKPGHLESIAAKLRSGDAMLLRTEQIVNWLDKNDVNGPWHKWLWNPLAKAQSDECDLARDVTAKLQEAMERMPEEQRMSLLDKFEVPGMVDEYGNAFSPTRKYLISMLFNMGNEENREKMIKGMGWAADPDLLGRAFSHLNSHDAQFVQDTWNVINELWPRIADLQHRLTGLEPVKVQAKPFELDLADGRYRFDGGYYPLKGNPLRSRVGARQESGPVVQLTDKGFERPQTSQGHTVERTRATYPLLMNFEQVLGPHVTQVIQDLTHREAVTAAYKIISDPEIRQTLAETIGEERMRQMLPWLKSVVNDRNPSAAQGLDAFSKVMAYGRRAAVTASMGFKLSTALVQYTGLTRSFHYVSPGDMFQALGQFLASPKQTIDMVRELSGEMRNRAENLDRDYREMMRNQTGDGTWRDQLDRFAFHGIAMADTGIGIPTWLGAFNQALKAGKDHDTAVLEADRAVRLTQPTAGAKDLPAMMRQNDAAKLLTMFYGHFSVLYQNLRDAGHQVQGVSDMPKFAARMLFSAVIPAVAGELLLNRGPQDDDDKRMWAIYKSLHFASSSIPILRDVATCAVSALEGKPGDYRFSPVADLMQKNMQAAVAGIKTARADSDQLHDDTLWKTAEALGYDFAIPGTAQAMASGRYLYHVARGETEDSLPAAAAHLAFGYHPPKEGR